MTDVIFDDDDNEEHIRDDESWKTSHPDYQEKVIYDGRNGGLQV